MADPDVHASKVLLVAPDMEPRGTSEYTVTLVRELKRLGVEAAVFCGPGPMLRVLERAGVPVTTFRRIEHMDTPLCERKAFLAAVEGFKPQLVHAQSFRVAGCLRALRRADRLPLLLTMHWRPGNARAMRRLSRELAGLIATTQAVREELVNECGVPRSKVKVIHNGINVERLPAEEECPIFRGQVPVVGSLGPVEEMRGHELFVRAAATLVNRGVQAQFVVAGAGTELPGLRKLVGSLGLERCVTISTDFSSYRDVLDALDVVVQSSQVDVSGFSILEAMGYGRPVVAFNTGTACEMIDDKKTGLLVPKGDVPALADAVQYLLSDANVARQMGANARRSVGARFNIRSIARETLHYYDDVLAAWARAEQS